MGAGKVGNGARFENVGWRGWVGRALMEWRRWKPR